MSESEDEDEVVDEVQRYLQVKCTDHTTSPFDWWRANESYYPQLSLLAKKYLCITATSVPCERMFSKAGCIIDSKRSFLDPNNANALLCLTS